MDLGRAPAGVRVLAPLRTYPVTSTTVAEARAEMRQAGPSFEGRRFNGGTQWRITWRYQLRPGAGACRFSDVRVQLEASITMPEWRPAADVDEEVKRWWRGYHAGLLHHERGHALLAVETAADIARELRRKVAPSCQELAAESERQGRRMLDELRSRQRAYDRETRHGATQIEAALSRAAEW